jgi:uncharacterized protein (DUF58 family)
MTAGVAPTIAAHTTVARRPWPAPTRRRTYVPREGAYWLLVTAALWLTGWFKGINLILLLAYVLVVMWVLNWVVARRMLQRAMVRRKVRGPVFAEATFTWEVEASVVGTRPLTGWEVVDTGPGHDVRWSLSNTPSGDSIRLWRDVTLTDRGPYDCPPVRAISSFPFGLVRQEVEYGVAERVIVLPRLGLLHAGRLRRWLAQTARPDERARRSRRRLAMEAEFHGLRQFRPGDSPRWIHWRTSARTGELVVREFDHGTHHDLLLVVEPFATAQRSAEVEAAVSLAATVCWSWSQDAQDRVVLAVGGPEPVVRVGGDGPDSMIDLLEALAVVRPASEFSPRDVGRVLHRVPLPAGPALLIGTRPDVGTADGLSRELDRPVAYVNAAQPPTFYQPPS